MLGRSRAGSGKLVLAALCAAFALAALPAEAQAFDLTISTDPTTNVTEAPPTPILGAPTTFTATADPAVLNVDQLDAALVNGNTVVRTGTTPGSITVATDIAASSAPGALELDPTGSIFINTTNISTGGSQTYDDAVTLGATTTLSSTSSGSINLSSTVNGAQALTVNTAGRTTVGDAVGGTTPLASLMITNPNGTTTLDGSGVTTTAGQTYQSPVTLGGNTVLSDGNVSAQSIDLSNHALTIAGGGTLTGGVTGAGGSLTKTGSGTLALQVANSYTGGTVIDAGTISFVSGGLGPGPVTVDGGGLEWAASNTVDVSSRLNPIGAGGATFNTNGHDVTLAQPLTGPGSVIKDGTGTLTLPAANTYSGATTVAQGMIHLTGSVTSHVTLNPPGTLNCDDGTLSGGLTNDGGTASSVPGAPSGVTPGPANGHANVAFTPGAAHCFPIGYTATSSPGAVHGSGIGSPITVSPLIDGTAYTFTVTATNPIGSAASAPSAAIVPKGPLPIARIHPVLVRLLISFTPTHGKPRTVVLNDIRLTR